VSEIDLDLARGLEERCFNAWPALRTMLVDGWVLRLSDGHTRRNNSATTFAPSSLPARTALDLVEATFRREGARPVVRLTPFAAADVAPELAARGYVDEDATWVMAASAPVSAAAASETAGLEIRLTRALEEEWTQAAMIAYGHGAAGARSLRRTLPLILPDHAYVTVSCEGKALAFGLGVAERGWIGLYDLVVDPAARGRGLGSAMIAALRAWGAEQGAPRAYLQVRAANLGARALYARLGFRDVFRYGNWARPGV
jgi:ribosomal protein S18 acetylase RimI-like enzyme